MARNPGHSGEILKVVILAGGLGTRISEETESRPKPMVDIGGKPILWHIMKIYSAHGVNDFIVCCGYRGYVIKEYFANYFLHNSDVTFDMRENTMEVHERRAEPWKVTLFDTGENTMTGGRLKRVAHLLEEDETFCFTYGDGVSDIDIESQIQFHLDNGFEATLGAVFAPGRFGSLDIASDERVSSFTEKPRGDGARISGGFFVLNTSVLSRIDSDATIWEAEPLSGLAQDGKLGAFKHDGFWHAMDTLRDKQNLERMWHGGNAPWKVW